MNLISCIVLMAFTVIFNLNDVETKDRRRTRTRTRTRTRIRFSVSIRRRGIDIDVDISRQRRAISDKDFNGVHQEIRDITHQETTLERKRRNAEHQDVSNVRQTGVERKRRDVDDVRQSSVQECKCSDAVQLSRCSLASLQKMDGHEYEMTIQRFYDPNGVPIYDVMKFTPRTGTAGVAPQDHYLTTITNECDCTSVLKPGNITIYGEAQNGQLVHGAMTNSDKLLEQYVLDTALIGGLVGGLLVLVAAISMALLVKRRRNARSESGQKSENHVTGVDNGSYEIKTVHG